MLTLEYNEEIAKRVEREEGKEETIIKAIRMLLSIKMSESDIRKHIIAEYTILDEKFEEYLKQAKVNSNKSTEENLSSKGYNFLFGEESEK